MKKLLMIFLISLLSIISYSQIGPNQNVYVEYHSPRAGLTFITDVYRIMLYDNVEEYIDSTNTGINAGFVIEMTFIYDSDEDSIRKILANNIYDLDEGIVRLKIWDTKLYGYCFVTDIRVEAGVFRFSLVGRKNVPQRKKLLFKDSPKLRMWNYPWIGQ